MHEYEKMQLWSRNKKNVVCERAGVWNNGVKLVLTDCFVLCCCCWWSWRKGKRAGVPKGYTTLRLVTTFHGTAQFHKCRMPKMPTNATILLLWINAPPSLSPLRFFPPKMSSPPFSLFTHSLHSLLLAALSSAYSSTLHFLHFRVLLFLRFPSLSIPFHLHIYALVRAICIILLQVCTRTAQSPLPAQSGFRGVWQICRGFASSSSREFKQKPYRGDKEADNRLLSSV